MSSPIRCHPVTSNGKWSPSTSYSAVAPAAMCFPPHAPQPPSHLSSPSSSSSSSSSSSFARPMVQEVEEQEQERSKSNADNCPRFRVVGFRPEHKVQPRHIEQRPRPRHSLLSSPASSSEGGKRERERERNRADDKCDVISTQRCDVVSAIVGEFARGGVRADSSPTLGTAMTMCFTLALVHALFGNCIELSRCLSTVEKQQNTHSLAELTSRAFLRRRILNDSVSLSRRMDAPELTAFFEDGAFRLLAPRTMDSIRRQTSHIRDERYIDWIVREVKGYLYDEGVEIDEVRGRCKSLLSIWKKKRRKQRKQSKDDEKNNNASTVPDILAIRIILPDPPNPAKRQDDKDDDSSCLHNVSYDACRRAMNVVTGALGPYCRSVCIKDYIGGIKKANGYQSLHGVYTLNRHGTPLSLPLSPPLPSPPSSSVPLEPFSAVPLVPSSSVPVEVQVRTRSMHSCATSGSSAHWRYKRDQGAR